MDVIAAVKPKSFTFVPSVQSHAQPALMIIHTPMGMALQYRAPLPPYTEKLFHLVGDDNLHALSEGFCHTVLGIEPVDFTADLDVTDYMAWEAHAELVLMTLGAQSVEWGAVSDPWGDSVRGAKVMLSNGMHFTLYYGD